LSLLLQVLAVILSVAKDPDGLDLPRHFGPFQPESQPSSLSPAIQETYTGMEGHAFTRAEKATPKGDSALPKARAEPEG
jgi:hypothetical protein